MKSKAHILIVEDKAMLYKRMGMFLTQNHYNVDTYTPSYDKALAAIHKKKPDLVLLDILLQGNKTGIDLGEKLSAKYGIPFIYVTDYGDDETFYQGLATNHEQFLVKTKPHLNTKELLRAIQTVLSKKKNATQPSIVKNGLMCYTGYINELKSKGKDSVSQEPVPFQEITIISKKTPTGEKLKNNYIRIETYNSGSYYLPLSLSDISSKLPIQFARINESEIINLNDEILTGRINGSRLKVKDTIFKISKTYKPEVDNRLELLYGAK